MRMSMKMAIVTVICILMGSFVSMAETGPGVAGKWLQDERGWWYQYGDASYPKSEWKEIDGEWYCFLDDGYRSVGWASQDGKRYWMDEDGKMVRNTSLTIAGVSYAFDENGVCNPNVELPFTFPAEEEKSELHHTVDQVADTILAQITTNEMSQYEKAAAIYNYIRDNMTYVSYSDKGDWVKAAFEGFRKKRGDCFTYYAMSLELLGRAGIPTIEVNRTDGHHWWNMVNCGDGWYHFDTTPRTTHTIFFMWTDAQLDEYSASRISADFPIGTHAFDHSKYPATPMQ